ncbi:MAG: hypothetical protein SCK70_09255, partial [bacterium]|nr:hypothetical protein [bacterium]
VYEAYKRVYQKHFKNEVIEDDKLDDLTKALLQLFDKSSVIWEHNMERNKVGQVFLRLMLSVKNMSGGLLGEFGYLNYLKNNLGNKDLDNQFIVEDKFGKKITRNLDKD